MMEVHFTPELEKTLKELAAQRGQAAGDLVQELVLASLGDVPGVRAMIDGRYDDLKSGRVKPIDGEEAFARLRAKSELRRNRPA
jgi:mRNA-degrading endonuclease RelE of RelBE toxin-antitoxin system